MRVGPASAVPLEDRQGHARHSSSRCHYRDRRDVRGDDAQMEAVSGLRATGYSWAAIGARLGITRQAAQQRWGLPTLSHVDPANQLQSEDRAERCTPAGRYD